MLQNHFKSTILILLILTFCQTRPLRVLDTPKEKIITTPVNVPDYIHHMINKYKQDENNIFFILSPVNSNHFHGDILHSSVNANAGGKNNTQVNVNKLNRSIEDEEIRVALLKMDDLEKTVIQLEQGHDKLQKIRKARGKKRRYGCRRHRRFPMYLLKRKIKHVSKKSPAVIPLAKK